MKKTSCFLLLAAWVGLGLAPLSAQTSFGLHGGMNYGKSRYDPDLPLQADNALGYLAGVTLFHRFSDRFGLGMDVQYALKASKLGLSAPADYRSHYAEIAPRAEFFFTKNIGISLGFYTARLLEQRVRSGNGSWIRTDKIFDIKRFDVGISPGIALRFGPVFGFLRYAHGLVPIDDITFTDVLGSDLEYHAHNRYFQAGIGYVIFE